MNTQQEISKKEIEAQFIEQMRLAHDEWLKHPTTVQLRKLLMALRENHINSLNAFISNPSIPDAFIRAQATNLKNTDAIIAVAFDVDNFIRLSTTQPKKD